MNNPFKNKKAALDAEEKKIVEDLVQMSGQVTRAMDRNSRIMSDQAFIILVLFVITLGLLAFILKKKLILVK